MIKHLLFIIFLCLSLESYILELDKKTTLHNLLQHSLIYIDHEQNLDFSEISNANIKFESNNERRLSYGYSPNFTVWIKFTLKNISDKQISKIIEYNNPISTNIFFYSPDLNYKPIHDGIFNLNSSRKTSNPFFKIDLKAFEEKTYFMKVSSNITTLIIDLKLWNLDDFFDKEISHHIKLSFFFGAMIILALYNLFIFFFTKDQSYLYYVVYMLGITFHHALYTGFGNIYNLFPQLNEYIISSASIIVAIPAFALALFTKSFLETHKYPKLNQWLNVYLILFPMLVLVFLYTDEFNRYRNIFSVLLLIMLFGITIFAAIKKNSQAIFILFGWFIFIAAGISMYLSSLGWFEIQVLIPYFVEILLVLEAVIFSVALAYRIKQLQLEKDRTHIELLQQKKNEQQRLKYEVKEKTKDLNEALSTKELLLKELNHRVKNNMQTILSLIRMQSDEFDDKKLEDAFITIQNRVNAMSHLHELLYKGELLSDVNAKEYFQNIVDDVKDSYEYIVEITYDIYTTLKIEQAAYCGLILNELVTNSCKYAFKDNNGKMGICLKKINSTYILQVNDNGIGYEQSQRTESLGLELVKNLISSQLRGELHIDSTNGVKVQVKWSVNE